MKLDKICRSCLLEKSAMKPLFGACIPNMLMTIASVQIMEGDGLPTQICTQCLQMVNRSYSFKQTCEKAETTLRQYQHTQNLISDVRSGHMFHTNDVMQPSIFTDIFNDANNSLVHNFSAVNGVESDLVETMQSLQTIADECLPPTWEPDVHLVHANSIHDDTCDEFSLDQFFKCQFCNNSFRDEWSLGEHIKIHSGSSMYFCNICGRNYPTTSELNRHIIEHTIQENTQNLSKAIVANKPLKKTFDCTICGKRYTRNKILIMHMRSHSGERPLSCASCGKTFSLPSSLYKHRLIHTNIKKHKCNICDKHFRHSSNYIVHMRTHTGQKPYICKICGKGCSTKINLEVHMRVHTGSKPFSCSTCVRAFSTSGQLKKHSLIHSGELPYKCWQCGKAFRHKDTRDTHLRYHTGERPFSCTICSKKYIAASHLRVHMKSHNNIRKYNCNICGKSLLDQQTLKMHILTHTGLKSQNCTYCKRKFTQISTLNRHIKNVHKKGDA